MLYEQLKDVIQYIKPIGVFDLLKLSGTKKMVELVSVSEDRSVILFGNFLTPIEGLITETVGLGRLNVLSGYYTFFDNNTKKANATLMTQDRGGVITPIGVSFSNNLDTFHYRFVSKSHVDRLVNINNKPKITWDYEFTVNDAQFSNFQSVSSVFISKQPLFSLSVKNGIVLATIGDDISADGGSVAIGETSNPNVNVQPGPRWNIKNFTMIVKNSTKTVKVSTEGALFINIKTASGSYDFYILAKNI